MNVGQICFQLKVNVWFRIVRKRFVRSTKMPQGSFEAFPRLNGTGRLVRSFGLKRMNSKVVKTKAKKR